MRKHVEESVATGVAAGRGRGGRFSAGRKREVVMRLLRGEDLESVSRAVGITAARASHWRAQFLAAGQAGLKSRAPDARDEDHRRLQAKIGELLMETELLYARVARADELRHLVESGEVVPRLGRGVVGGQDATARQFNNPGHAADGHEPADWSRGAAHRSRIRIDTPVFSARHTRVKSLHNT